MKQHNEFNSDHEHEHNSGQHMTQKAARQFSSAEEMLREDANRITVPPAIAQRLQKSSANLPKPGRSFWQRLFGQ